MLLIFRKRYLEAECPTNTKPAVRNENYGIRSHHSEGLADDAVYGSQWSVVAPTDALVGTNALGDTGYPAATPGDHMEFEMSETRTLTQKAWSDERVKP